MNRRTLPFGSSFRTIAFLAFVCALLLGLGGPLQAASEINTGYFGNVAIKGYDPVAYFTQGEATQGSEEHAYQWLGASWRFVSEEHKALFAANPQNYAPQYGGHCATGMAISGGLTRDIDPEAWLIIDDKLYLNYSKATNELLANGSVTTDQANSNWANPGNAAQ